MQEFTQPIGFGVCRLAVVPVRAKAAEAAEQVTQLLYGEHYRVMESSDDGSWLRIISAFDDYEGWIGNRVHTAVGQDFYEELEKQPYQRACGDLSAIFMVKGSAFPLVYGSLLPFTRGELFQLEEQLEFKGKVLEIKKINEPSVLKTLAMPYFNAPYQWGGKSPFGIDCSGFTQMVYRLAGYSLKRDASQQLNQGKEVRLANAKIGDLAFFVNAAGRCTHVGMMLDATQIMHASGRVRIDRLDEKGIIDSETGKYTHQLKVLKRIIS